jgi:hypothetical protein
MRYFLLAKSEALSEDTPHADVDFETIEEPRESGGVPSKVGTLEKGITGAL